MVLKVVSLNLWHGTLIKNACQFLKQEDADIVMLQEVYGADDSNPKDAYKSLAMLKRELDYADYDFVPAAVFVNKEGKFPNGNAIFSKFPIKHRDHSFFHEAFNEAYLDIPENYPFCPRILQHVEVATPVGAVNILNFHGVWDLDGDNYSDRRQQMSQKIIEAVQNKPRVILGGDTNAKPTNKAILDIEEHVKSVFGRSLTTTFNMQRKDNPGYATAAVDMLFVDPSIEALSTNCPAVDVSDHLPLTAELLVH